MNPSMHPPISEDPMLVARTAGQSVSLRCIRNATQTHYHLAHSTSGVFHSPSHLPSLYSAPKALIIPTVYKMKSRFLRSSGAPQGARSPVLGHHLPLLAAPPLTPRAPSGVLLSLTGPVISSVLSFMWVHVSHTLKVHLKYFIVLL